MTFALSEIGWPGYVLMALVGASIGSFCNVVIYRLPIMLKAGPYADGMLLAHLKQVHGAFTLASPASTCPGCRATVKPWHNLPVLSWLMLRGRCASCKTRISKQYIAVELTFATGWPLLAYSHGLSVETAWLLLLGTVSFCLGAVFAAHSVILRPLLYCWLGIFATMIVTLAATAPHA